MTIRPGTAAAAVLIVVVGFAIGAWLAIRSRGADQQTHSVSVASSTAVAPATRTVAPRPVRTAAPTVKPTALPTAASITTIAPAPTPAAPVSPMPTATPAPAAAAAPAVSTLQGSWQIDEANVQVGTIRWVGDAEPAPGNAIAFTVHKQSIAGRTASRCERQTELRAALSPGVTTQSAPYREVNCEGVVSTGEIRVSSFSGNSGSFTGSFWRNGTNLGAFTARKL
jgi:hypothetical protein